MSAWTVEEAGSVLVHEVHHLIRDHSGRAVLSGVEEGQARRWNVAADLEINDDLSDLALPVGGCHPEGFAVPEGELAETYFFLLGDTDPRGPECGSGTHGIPARWDLADEAGVSAAEADLIRQQVAQDVQALAARGAAPGGLARWATELLKPRVDWRRQLRSLVSRGVGQTAGMTDFSYARPSRRSGGAQGPRVLLPSMVRPVPRLAVVVDTSRSMGAGALSSAMAEVRGLLRDVVGSRHPLTVLSCDASLQGVESVFETRAVHLAGGGGTDMGVGLQAAWALRPPPQVVIVLTDGLTPWPERALSTQRVIVGLLGDHGAAPAWARSVRIPL
jgi:predicted metal-dependent peptidase